VPSFQLVLPLPHPPEAVFAAIHRLGGWWSGAFTGAPDRLGAEFVYTNGTAHTCRMRVDARSPSAIAWHVVSADLPWATPPDEWVGSTIRFGIAPTPEGSTLTFTHEGLVPEHDCYGACESAWTVLLQKNLVTLLATGEDQPSPWR